MRGYKGKRKRDFLKHEPVLDIWNWVRHSNGMISVETTIPYAIQLSVIAVVFKDNGQNEVEEYKTLGYALETGDVYLLKAQIGVYVTGTRIVTELAPLVDNEWNADRFFDIIQGTGKLKLNGEELEVAWGLLFEETKNFMPGQIYEVMSLVYIERFDATVHKTAGTYSSYLDAVRDVKRYIENMTVIGKQDKMERRYIITQIPGWNDVQRRFIMFEVTNDPKTGVWVDGPNLNLCVWRKPSTPEVEIKKILDDGKEVISGTVPFLEEDSRDDVLRRIRERIAIWRVYGE